jgi:hypothetical protein
MAIRMAKPTPAGSWCRELRGAFIANPVIGKQYFDRKTPGRKK